MSDRRTHHYAAPADAAYNASHLAGSQYQLAYTDQYSSPSYSATYSSARPHSVVGGSYDQSATPAHGHSNYHMTDQQMNYTYAGRPDRPLPMSMHHSPTYHADGAHGMAAHSSRMAVHSPSRPRSTHPYGVPSSSPPHSPSVPSHAPGMYPGQVAYAQQVNMSQYPASPQRPFACDMCALSFNRQHDLKRHRDTHTGEKPFVCNGGCGKTFTRKDALKRHQLVKRCGIDEDAA
ncbi:hypothetical protein DAEQUDRAFT_810245 [Daedalea quercina L-15889]|uniref:C2H2-type domain-containing protein n=1 Tax=Daedalea quercina L-15889 TaxID=1314783 RepID=A0A165RNM1_9APHY|nr:hypothetical protein DAEQUDRAFT_810245 [Daedalea quercina L-15889]